MRKVELGKLAKAGLVIVASRPFPHSIHHIEFYNDPRLMLLVYNTPDLQDELMHYELREVAADAVAAASTILIVDHNPKIGNYGYWVPVVHGEQEASSS